MRGFVEQTTSESERSYPVVPDKQTGKRSMPSEESIPARGEGRIIYSLGHYDTSYSLRFSDAPRER
jgi:hypothetical protein